ncbi:MAG: hypothetical protein L6246_08190 [Thermodesulfovibrionales bacterium]|nr:hypothetical protein [Thermodesulfovibrionales bacterium]
MKAKNLLNVRILLFTVYCLLFVAMAGCAAVLKQDEIQAQRADYGQISLLMSEPEKASVDITFNLIAVNAMAEDGTYREITHTPLVINYIAMSGSQILIGERALQ